MQCPNCNIEMKKVDTDYPCPYCIEHENCFSESVDNPCTSFDAYECGSCGYTEVE